ncbi:MAG: agmatine deiminase family protein [Alcanivoracaceae bacterium]|nr:agmatine deiminase family protein [Alcanivoracaceae bacterium]
MTLLPEWHPQWGVLLAWPHAATDWRHMLPQADHTYTALGKAILDHEQLLVICRDPAHEAHVRERLHAAGARTQGLQCLHAPFNDTWARDFGPLVVERDGATLALDFIFNGWGNKFPSQDDNALTAQLPLRIDRKVVDMVLEGGSVESNGEGLLLTTEQCLLNPNRNPDMDRLAVERALADTLGAENVLWLRDGDLEGDDTDAHIDTLARFCDPQTIAYVQCTDSNDSHYPALQAMEQQLQALAERHRLSLVPLPMATAQYDADGQRLPATYANFLIINGAVLVPTYECATDEAALAALRGVFPERRVIGIPCRPLIEQHGSLHCVTMQLPEGVL